MGQDKGAEYLNILEASRPLIPNPMDDSNIIYRYLFQNSLSAAVIICEKEIVYYYPEHTLDLDGDANIYLKKSYEEFVYPGDLNMVDEYITSLYQKVKPQGLLRFRVLDGQNNPIWVEISGQPIFYHNRPAVLILANSLTNNWRKMQYIKDYSNEYRIFADKSPDGIVVRKGTRILYANSAAVKRTGFSLEELKQMDLYSAVDPEDAAAARELMAKWDEGHVVPAFIELGIKGAGGDTFTCEVASSLISYHGEPAVQHTFRDVSYRKRMEQELKMQANLLANINECIIVTDADYQILFWNQGAEKLLGFPAEKVLGHNLEYVLNKVKFIDHISNNLVNDGFWEGQLDLVTVTGDSKSIKLSVTRITDACNPIHIVIIANDITELLNAQRRESEANQAKSDFLARLSHELRTPLVGIVGYCELLKSNHNDALTQEKLTTIEHCARQMLDLANNMLDLSKIDARQVEIKQQDFDLYDVITYTINSFCPHAKTGVEISAHISPQVPRLVKGDQTKVKQIISNLLTNAFKFTSRGYIKVKVELELNYKAAQGFYPVKIAVIDSGIGIDENERSRIFEPFIHDVACFDGRGGTGLGLAICKQFAELMGGCIWCDANPEGGSEFNLILPLEAAAFHSDQPAPSTPAPGGFKGLKVLLAEDISVNRKLITLMLEKAGCEVAAVNNGEECINKLGDFSPDVILMDMQMPVLDGFGAARMIKSNPCWNGIPIIALTAYAMTNDIIKCQEAGCDSYLSKPFTSEQLINALKQYVPAENHC